MPTSADLALVDTNVLVHAFFPDAPQTLTRVYTYNRSDFEKVREIDVLTP